MERLLGCTNYPSCFLPKLAEVVASLRQLTEKSIPFYWQTQQESAFEQVRKLVTNSPVLKFYDASEKGLGATLLQKGQPVAFASRALNKTKQSYRANYIIV